MASIIWKLLAAIVILACTTASIQNVITTGKSPTDWIQHPTTPTQQHDTPIVAGQYALTRQDETVCAGKGESQWSGTIDVSDQRRLFFWFADSQHDPARDPIILWINGGPGGSSMIGLLTEIGPCTLQYKQNITKPNEWSWNRNASVLFIDQPAGAGLSTLSPGAPLPSSDTDGAEDFQTFLRIFFDKVFPERAHLPIHFASESYGGHYAPTYLEHIVESRRRESTSAFRGNISSMILVSPLTDLGASSLGTYELLCVDPKNKGIYNESTCNHLRESYSECWRLREQCILDESKDSCNLMTAYCTENMQSQYTGYLADIKYKGECPDQRACDNGFGNITQYLNQPHVLSTLGFPEDFGFRDVNHDMFNAYIHDGSVARSISKELRLVLDAHLESGDLGDFRVLVVGGNNDFACNVPGNKLAFDNLPWSGLADYRFQPWAALPESLGQSGEWKGVKNGRLVFVAMDNAAHMVPSYQPEASYRILEKWLNNWWQD